MLLLIALTGYTVKNAWKNEVFFSWSYFSGWLAFPFFVLAGNLRQREEGGGDYLRVPLPRRDPQPPFQETSL